MENIIKIIFNKLAGIITEIKSIPDAPFALSNSSATQEELDLIDIPLVITLKTKDVARRNFIGVYISFLIAFFSSVTLYFMGFPLVLVLFNFIFWVVFSVWGVSVAKKMLNTPGCWKITLDNNGIDWRSPDENIDKSFFLPLSEIKCIGTERIKSMPVGPFNDLLYNNVVILMDGSHFYFEDRSGMNINMIYVGLQKLGKPYMITHTKASRLKNKN